MKVVDLNGKESHWKLTGHTKTLGNKSSLHIKARELLQQLYPNVLRLEEVPIKVFPQKVLYLDFYLPLYNKAIEVHGQQHYAFSTMFHESRLAFKRQQLNDLLKEEWCEQNKIELIVLPFNEVSRWTMLITN